MSALAIIELIRKDLKENPPLIWKDPKCSVEFLLRAFDVMKKIAYDDYQREGEIYLSNEQVKINIEIDFEEAMKDSRPSGL